jgi:hypothetical protein
MKRASKVAAAATAIALVALTSASAGSAPAPLPGTANPTSGPPGTVVNVANVPRCASNMTIGWAANPLQPKVIDPQPFTPPSGTTTVPELPNGTYYIALVCGVSVTGLGFEVTGSAVAPPPVSAAPNFSG